MKVFQDLAEDLFQHYKENPELTAEICEGIESNDAEWKAQLAALTAHVSGDPQQPS